MEADLLCDHVAELEAAKQASPCGLTKSCSFHPDHMFMKNHALGEITVYIILKSRNKRRTGAQRLSGPASDVPPHVRCCPQRTRPTCPHRSASLASSPAPTAAASRSAGSATGTMTAWTAATRPPPSAVSARRARDREPRAAAGEPGPLPLTPHPSLPRPAHLPLGPVQV